MAKPPNVVVILADDLGYSDLGCFGGEIATPNLDRLAAGGLRMSNFYATPRCSPSRASLLTGRYSHEVGIGILTANDAPEGYPGSLSTEVPTLPELLTAGGYRTGLVGKWHLSSDISEPNETWPTRRGFQEFYGILGGAASYFAPGSLRRGEDQIPVAELPDDYYFTTAITDEAVRFVTADGIDSSADQPFFLYLAYTAPHWPLQAPPADIAAQAGRFAAGWDDLRAQRIQRLIDEGIFPEAMPPSPRDPAEPAWAQAPNHTYLQRLMEIYAAQVESLDRGVGEVIAALERRGVLDDTIIIFLSDNGASAAEISKPPNTGLPPVVCPPETRDGRPVRIGNDVNVLPGAEDTYAAYGRAWANLSNTPFRRYKRWVHEGGIATPFIVHWPNGELRAGEIAHAPAHIVDLLPTLLTAAGRTPAPEQARGADLLASWRSEAGEAELAQQRPLFWEHVGNAAVRLGDLKLVREHGMSWELYDLAQDRGELNDLASIYPEKVAELSALWEEWAQRTGVLPWQQVMDLYERRGQDPQRAGG